ncbi:MAG: MBL fold metallo-hydrolase [Anaerolineae bacterium]
MLEKIKWLGHDGFRIEGEKTVYIDPFKLKGSPKAADIILITHEHYDHFSAEDVEKVRTDDTEIVTIPAVAEKLSGEVHTVKPGDSLTVKGIPIEAVAAYNVNKFRSPGVPFHPKNAEHVGFILTMGGKRIYHTGDSDVIPEMDDLKVDIALIPVSGTYVMTADEAVDAAERIKPELAIPMHYNAIVGSLTDARKFKESASVPVEILEQES